MNPWPIPPLTQNDLDFAVVNYDFSGLTGNALADEPGLEAAIDSSLLDFATSIADQTTLIAVMFDGLDDLGSIIGEIDGSPLDGVLGELANTAAAGDAALGDYQAQLGDGGAPPPGGGTGGSPVPINNQTAFIDATSCEAAVPWPGQGTRQIPFSLSITLTNKSANTVKMDSMTLVQPHPGTFTATTNCTGTLAPNESCSLFVTQEKFEGNGTIFAFDLKFTTPNKTERICLQVGLNQGGGPGGGGGGTGITFV